jgi:hypothetical protein
LSTSKSPGVEIRLCSPRLLTIRWQPAKAHEGQDPLPPATIELDPVLDGGPTAYLADLCSAAGGLITVSASSKDSVRKALGRMGKRALPESEVVITPYVLRHQVIADLKRTVGAGEQVAIAAGQRNDREQSRYGRVEHGRQRRGFICAKSTRAPRTGNVERPRELAAKRLTSCRTAAST